MCSDLDIIITFVLPQDMKQNLWQIVMSDENTCILRDFASDEKCKSAFWVLYIGGFCTLKRDYECRLLSEKAGIAPSKSTSFLLITKINI